MSTRARIDRPTELGEAHFRWFAAVAEKGMKPMDAILAATRNVAAAYKKLDEFGTLERGKLADVVVLDGIRSPTLATSAALRLRSKTVASWIARRFRQPASSRHPAPRRDSRRPFDDAMPCGYLVRHPDRWIAKNGL
jgi:hypothetical protein